MIINSDPYYEKTDKKDMITLINVRDRNNDHYQLRIMATITYLIIMK